MMIFNRTQSDIDNALNIRETKVKTFQQLTNKDIQILERGTLTINTLNRIENKQSELKELFDSMKYYSPEILNFSWNYAEIFDIVNFERILENLNILREAFIVYSDTPNVPSASYHFENINAIEKILHDLDKMIDDIISNYRECGNVECGEE